MGRLDHEVFSANFGVVASRIPHAHSSSMVSMLRRSDHELMAESLAGFPGFESGGVVGSAGVLQCNDFFLTAAQGPRTELQALASIKACEHDSRWLKFSALGLREFAC